jgi:hypothetical protein
MKENKKVLTKEIIDIYNEMVLSLPEIENKGKTMSYTSLNGNMFTFLDKDGYIAIRLSKNELVNFFNNYNSSLVISNGLIMKEYVRIPDELLKNKELLKEYFVLSLEYAKKLVPKPTKKGNGIF